MLESPSFSKKGDSNYGPITIAEEIVLPASTERTSNVVPLIGQSHGLIVRKVSSDAARSLLAELDEFDQSEQRDTLAFLKTALNETRAAQGARLIFLDEQTDPA
jgi:hypothetical protein